MRMKDGVNKTKRKNNLSKAKVVYLPRKECSNIAVR